MPTLVLCMSTRARRSLLERLPRKSLTNLLAYLRLSPQPPHCHALRFSRSGASSHVQRSMRPALHALAKAWVKPAEEMAYRKAVSLKPGKYYRVQHKYHFQKEAFFSTIILHPGCRLIHRADSIHLRSTKILLLWFCKTFFCIQVQQTTWNDREILTLVTLYRSFNSWLPLYHKVTGAFCAAHTVKTQHHCVSVFFRCFSTFHIVCRWDIFKLRHSPAFLDYCLMKQLWCNNSFCRGTVKILVI